MKSNRVWLWLIPLTLLWPGLHLLVFLVRFGRLPSGGMTDMLVFLPMSLVSGIVFIVLWIHAAARPQKAGLVLGYLLTSPLAFIYSLFSGLLMPPIIGALLCGAVPLVVGMLIGYALTKSSSLVFRGNSRKVY